VSERHEEIIEEWMIRAMDWKARAEKAEAALADVYRFAVSCIEADPTGDVEDLVHIIRVNGYGDAE
jgi:hypothetical protein